MIKIKSRYLLAAAGATFVVSLAALIHNNVQMGRLRQAVYDTDKSGGNVQGALTNLQHYVVSHMNTDLSAGNNTVYPPIQLKYTYERLKAKNASSVNNDQIYSDAQVYCEQQNSTDFSGRNRIDCIQQYVTSHNATVPQAIPDSLYKFDFISPAWSPDLAGWSLVVTFLLVVAAVLLFIIRKVRGWRGDKSNHLKI